MSRTTPSAFCPWSSAGLLAVMLALGSAGCALSKPTLAFKSARVSDVDLEGTTLQITYTLKNPNPIGISLARVSYALEVEGHKVISGQPPKGLQVAPKGTSDLVFPARVRFLEIAPLVQALANKDQASYRASGTVGIDTPIGVVELPLSYSGTFPVPKMPHIQFRPPQFESLSTEGVRIRFPIELTNSNSFPIPLGELSANFVIAGASVGSARATAPASLGAKQSRVVEIPLEVNFLESGLAVANALQSGRVHVKVEGSLRSGGASVPIALDENLQFH